MELYIGGQLFDTECPKNCPGKDEYLIQGGLCHRCPIFNCVPDKEGFCLIDSMDYRKDWALEFRKWFNNGCVDYPTLLLKYEKTD